MNKDFTLTEEYLLTPSMAHAAMVRLADLWARGSECSAGCALWLQYYMHTPEAIAEGPTTLEKEFNELFNYPMSFTDNAKDRFDEYFLQLAFLAEMIRTNDF